MPDHDGAAYRMHEMTVAQKMSCSDVVGVPCERSTRIAYSMLHAGPDDRSAVTLSAAVNLSFSMTPRTRKLDTRSKSVRGGGSATFRLAEKTIFFVLPRFSFKLLSVDHACKCSISLWHDCARCDARHNQIGSSANLKIRLR